MATCSSHSWPLTETTHLTNNRGARASCSAGAPCSSLLCGEHLGAVLPSVQRRSYSEGTTYFDSQSGRTMTVPGSAGVRVRELSTLVHGSDALRTLLPAGLTSFAWRGLPIPPEPEPHSPSCTLVVPVSGPEAARALAAAAAAGGANPERVRPLVELELGSGDGDEAIGAAVALLRKCRAHGLRPHALVRRAWRREDPGDDSGENLHAEALERATLAVADAEADIVTLSDCLAHATEDSLRDAVEAAFYIDVAGETMMERLTLRLPGARPELLGTALQLGVTRFEANSCSRPCDREGKQCVCEGAGFGWVVGTRRLLAEVKAAGKSHRVDVGKLP